MVTLLPILVGVENLTKICQKISKYKKNFDLENFRSKNRPSPNGLKMVPIDSARRDESNGTIFSLFGEKIFFHFLTKANVTESGDQKSTLNKWPRQDESNGTIFNLFGEKFFFHFLTKANATESGDQKSTLTKWPKNGTNRFSSTRRMEWYHF